MNDPDYIELRTELEELLFKAQEELLLLEGDQNIPDHYDPVFRVFHSAKGACGMFGLIELQSHLHKVESTFTELKSAEFVCENTIHYFLKAIDHTLDLFAGISAEFNYQSFEELQSGISTENNNEVESENEDVDVEKVVASESEPEEIAPEEIAPEEIAPEEIAPEETVLETEQDTPETVASVATEQTQICEPPSNVVELTNHPENKAPSKEKITHFQGTIALIDDNKDMLEIHQELIEAETQMKVLTYDSSSKFLTDFYDLKLDLIICDYQMPDYDGLDVLDKVRRLHPELGFILLSGHLDKNTVVSAVRLRATSIIEKPLAISSLMMAINEIRRLDMLWKCLDDSIHLLLKQHVLINSDPIDKQKIIDQKAELSQILEIRQELRQELHMMSKGKKKAA